MKLLGHAWVAINAYLQGNKKLLILGSILPEIMYYTKDHPFEFQEIHEGGDKVYRYLRDRSPEFADLGIGMLAHSVKAGADKYNFDGSLMLLGYDGDEVDKLRSKLSEVLGITYDTAKIRAHNILELAIDLKIIQEHPDFVRDFNEAVADINVREKIVEILSNCFQKPREAVSKRVNELLDKVKPVYFNTAEGLADLWAELSKVFDPTPDRQRLAEFLEELSMGYGDKSEEFLRECINWTRSNLEKIGNNPEKLLDSSLS